ncbi:ester cyclase [Streptomyces cellulosae]|jgi:predicted ester cyclase|uniref:Ester cyclase n=2 Tax=Streptomyces TaxID=1883 RepID=A0ABU0KII9_9ACTN|nr:ester cyclase [Streptomyces sp. McG7]MBT2905299.1 ester cyclase [Streptomyces sp. McG8]MCX4478827.1 ester cyclase [Streptomyces cellulosae]MDQ0489119.1 putative ester cyclase [Streptomyces thermodiastaticus]MYW55564.1 ester cyclase [Streptomyces sp. SID8376]UVT11331.1 ester cyclase [Streptomyces thermocarboxydus]
MTFVQLIDCRTDRFEELDRLMDQWVEQTRGRRTATHAVVGRDRGDTSHLVEIVEFPSYEEAMRNSKLPETDRIFREMTALCEGTPTFTDLDVVRDARLNADTAGRFFEVVTASYDLSPLADLVEEDYHDHDPKNEQDVVGLKALTRELDGWRASFDFRFRVEDRMAQGDRVCTRWTWEGIHKGDFLDIPATGKRATMTGMTVLRFSPSGKIAEGWWEYDRLGLLGQLGVLEPPEL